MNSQTHFSYAKENEGVVDFYFLEPGVSLSFNQIHTNSWTKGDSSFFSDDIMILNFCIHGRCDVSLPNDKYAIVKERQVCISTHFPTKDFYYPGRLYEGLQIYLNFSSIRLLNDLDFLSQLGISIDDMKKKFCSDESLYMQKMNESIYDLVLKIWKEKENCELGELRYFTVQILHELMHMPQENENKTHFTRSQIAIVKDAETMILNDLSKRISAKELADHYGISESSFKLYMKEILGDSYLSYFRKKRMEKACELLKTTNQKIIDVAGAVGYENQSKFAKVFMQYYGMSPLEYKRISKKDS